MSEYFGYINISLNAVLRRTVDNPDMLLSPHTRFFFVSSYLHFTTYRYPEWPTLIQPTTSDTQRKKLKKVWATYDTQTLIYCLFTPNYSSITPVCVGWVPDVHTHLFVITLSPPNACHVVTWPPGTYRRWKARLFIVKRGRCSTSLGVEKSMN